MWAAIGSRRSTGASITLTEGGKAGDLFDTLVTALQTDAIGRHWIVSVSNDGTLITFTDPATIAPWANADFERMQPDYPSRLTPES